MNLTFCHHCGVVLHYDILPWPTDILDEDGVIDPEKASWDGKEHSPKVACPVCKGTILASERRSLEILP